MKLPRDVTELVAEGVGGDARYLSGAVNRLLATSEAHGTPVNLELAEAALGDLFRSRERLIRLPDIERAVSQVFGLEPETLKSKEKARPIGNPTSEFWKLGKAEKSIKVQQRQEGTASTG